MKVLYIDDEGISRIIITRVLEENGNTCDTAQGIRDAIVHMRLHEYDVIILDFSLAAGTAVDLFKYIHNVPVVIYTAHEPQWIKEQVPNLPYPVIEKDPLDFNQLLRAIVEEHHKFEDSA